MHNAFFIIKRPFLNNYCIHRNEYHISTTFVSILSSAGSLAFFLSLFLLAYFIHKKTKQWFPSAKDNKKKVNDLNLDNTPDNKVETAYEKEAREQLSKIANANNNSKIPPPKQMTNKTNNTENQKTNNDAQELNSLEQINNFKKAQQLSQQTNSEDENSSTNDNLSENTYSSDQENDIKMSSSAKNEHDDKSLKQSKDKHNRKKHKSDNSDLSDDDVPEKKIAKHSKSAKKHKSEKTKDRHNDEILSQKQHHSHLNKRKHHHLSNKTYLEDEKLLNLNKYNRARSSKKKRSRDIY